MSSTLHPPMATPFRKRGLAAFALLAVLTVSGCSQGSSNAGSTGTTTAASQAEDGAFPVTIKSNRPRRDHHQRRAETGAGHGLGIGRHRPCPGRSADLHLEADVGWRRTGVFPVDAPGRGQADRGRPETKEFYSESGDLNFEVILDEDPDIILAPYSGFSQEDYARLSEIAPTVPYDNKPWQPKLMATNDHQHWPGTWARAGPRVGTGHRNRGRGGEGQDQPPELRA